MTKANTGPRQRVALVFGGSRGIGAAVAERLAADGFAVALTYATRADKADAVVRAIGKSGGSALAIAADSADPVALRAAVDRTVASFGGLDVAVINAGVYRSGPIDTFSVADLDLILQINVRGVFLAIQATAAEMRDGGRIVAIGSNTADRPSGGSAAYAMSKAAVAAMVKGIALDLAPRRITVNTVQPGPTETDLTSGFIATLQNASPLGRAGKPSEIAGLVAYLAGPEADYVTGASLTIDGGFSL
ncbi:SDR family oxidoreductase [Flavisphingomonas formosensis]|uniref:SDR family oxidoreductase n=1 Tax=Flavisphingomonas formosensis TaxID=861534 RepID=UPI0012F86CB4|nr:SDR family oxidoreductase [Sphingomonas formosensis]